MEQLQSSGILELADLGKMTGALRPDPAKLQSKGINSVRSRVTNLRPLLSKQLDTEQFISFIESFVAQHSGITGICIEQKGSVVDNPITS